ncbi:MAG: hypothetical protein KTR22_13690, partial [Flavobacteriaceae bacterium]|nr:hypothetical protein [Flavobacteriaceae bacterium]
QDAKGLAVYTDSKNLPTAIASILSHAQNRANFHPARLTPEQLAVYFQDYISEIDSVPFFGLLKNVNSKSKYKSKDYNKLIDQVVNLYDGVSAEDKNGIKNSIADMAKSVFSKESKEDWKNIFSQATIDLSNPSQPRLFIYYTTLHMKYERRKAEVKLQEFSVNKTEYAILSELIAANAERLLSIDKKRVSDWLGESTSKERNNAKLCFTPEPVKLA